MYSPPSIDLTLVSEWRDGCVRQVEDCVAGEEPLEIRVDGKPLSVTMRTPGHDFELAAGYLFTEGVITARSEIDCIRRGVRRNRPKPNTVEIRLDDSVSEGARVRRRTYSNSSCGICGKTSVEGVRVRGMRPLQSDLRADPEMLCALPDRLRSAQTIFGHTGGLHAAGLFDAHGELVALREDIGRHNAVDKVIGWALLAGRMPLAEHMIVVSGRGGFEIVQKAIVAGIPLLASVSAPSGLAVRLAREFGLTLVGFLRGRRFVIYAGEDRVLAAEGRRDGSTADSAQ